MSRLGRQYFANIVSAANESVATERFGLIVRIRN
jgi:hypothetical protein